MWISIALGVTFIFVVGYSLWSVATATDPNLSSKTRALVATNLALIVVIFWICSVWAQSGLDEINQIKENEAKSLL